MHLQNGADLQIRRPLVDCAIRYGEAETLSLLLGRGTAILVNGDGDLLRYDDGSTVLNDLLQYGSSRDSIFLAKQKFPLCAFLWSMPGWIRQLQRSCACLWNLPSSSREGRYRSEYCCDISSRSWHESKRWLDLGFGWLNLGFGNSTFGNEPVCRMLLEKHGSDPFLDYGHEQDDDDDHGDDHAATSPNPILEFLNSF